jgi:hypothetical protein
MAVTLAPKWVRRPMSLLLVVGLVFAVTLLPLLVIVAAAASVLLPGRWRPLRLLAFALVYLTLECIGLAVAFLLWLASGFGAWLDAPVFQRAHYAVLHGLLAVVLTSATLLFHLRVVDDEVSWSPLDDGLPGSTNAMVVLSRHAGPGDSLLLVRTLMRRDHDRQPRIVLKDLLQLDPLLDVYLNRLPTAFLTTGRTDLAEQVGALAQGMGTEDALLLFPEGGNFTEERRRRAIDRLRGKGLHDQADRADRMRYVLPPRPGGVAAALAAAPGADVVLVAHTGLEHLSTVADLWDGLPMDSVVRMRWWFVPASDVPRDESAQNDWLYARWAEIDAWIASYAGQA